MPITPPNEPEVLVQSLYRQVVARAPVGLLHGEDRKIFDPYLSKSLLHRIELAHSCEKDWYRQNPDSEKPLSSSNRAVGILKPPFAWLEAGLFSGGDEKTSPGSFQIESTQAEKNGSFRVVVRLTYRASDGPGFWRVAAIVIRENDHFVVDDVIYLKDVNQHVEWRLSQRLSSGCNGSHWVGYGEAK
jgi:hypothetical protein